MKTNCFFVLFFVVLLFFTRLLKERLKLAREALLYPTWRWVRGTLSRFLPLGAARRVRLWRPFSKQVSTLQLKITLCCLSLYSTFNRTLPLLLLLVGLLYPFPMDCLQTMKNGNRNNGVYTVYINNDRSKPIQVYCDMTTDGGGWLVYVFD